MTINQHQRTCKCVEIIEILTLNQVDILGQSGLTDTKFGNPCIKQRMRNSQFINNLMPLREYFVIM